MPQQGQIKVAIPGTTDVIAFPSSMAESDINSAIQDYMLKTGKGMVDAGIANASKNVKPLPTSGPQIDKSETPGVMGSLHRTFVDTPKSMYHAVVDPVSPNEVGAMGAERATSPMGAVMPDAIQKVIHRVFMQPAMNTAQEGSQYFQNAGQSWKSGHPLDAAGNALSGTADMGLSAIPLVGPMINQIAHRDERGDTSGALTDIATLKLFEKAPELIRSGGKTAVSEIMGEGPSKQAMLQERASHAQRVQQHVANVEQVVHADANRAMSQPIQKIDAANPGGVFPKDDIAQGIKDTWGDIDKIDDKTPPTISKLIQGPEQSKVRALTNSELQAANVIKKTGGLSPAEMRSMAENLGFAPKQVDAIMSTLGDVKEEGAALTAEQLKQHRSNLGQEMQGLSGTKRAAAEAVYGYLSDQLRKAARDTGERIGDKGLEAEWLHGNARYKSYIDDFVKSPVRKILNAKNPDDVFSTLTDKNGKRTQDIIAKYTQEGADPKALAQEAKRAGIQNTVARFSRPSKMDLMIAALSPKAAALRVAVPYFLRNPKYGFVDSIGGSGLPEGKATPFDAKIAAKKVSLSK